MNHHSNVNLKILIFSYFSVNFSFHNFVLVRGAGAIHDYSDSDSSRQWRSSKTGEETKFVVSSMDRYRHWHRENNVARNWQNIQSCISDTIFSLCFAVLADFVNEIFLILIHIIDFLLIFFYNFDLLFFFKQ